MGVPTSRCFLAHYRCVLDGVGLTWDRSEDRRVESEGCGIRYPYLPRLGPTGYAIRYTHVCASTYRNTDEYRRRLQVEHFWMRQVDALALIADPQQIGLQRCDRISVAWLGSSRSSSVSVKGCSHLLICVYILIFERRSGWFGRCSPMSSGKQ